MEKKPLVRIGYVVKMFPRLSETFILNEILELESRGVEVVIFSLKKPNEGRFHPQLAILKASVIYLDDLDVKKWPNWIESEWPVLSPNSRELWKLLNEAFDHNDIRRIEWILGSAWLASQAQKLGLSHLHAHFATLPSTYAYFAHRISGIPFSFTAHAKDIFVYDTEEHFLREKAQAAGFVVTVTNFNLRYLQEKLPHLDKQKIRVIYNGINVDYFGKNGPTRREPNLILSVGRLVAKKGFNILLEACKLLKDKGVSFRCLIVGEGGDLEILQNQKESLGLTQEVIFAGPKNLDEVRDLMHQSSIFCLPCVVASDNNVDALPTVLLEALASGLPAISTAVSGIPEIIDTEVDGILVAPEDAEALSREMERLLTSAELQGKFSKNGIRKASERFNLHKNVDTLLKAYLESVRNNGETQRVASLEMPTGTTYGKK